jgi:hypothetical protein
MTPHRNALVFLVVAAIATTSITPTLAAGNGGLSHTSMGTNKPVAAAAAAEEPGNLCGSVKGYLDYAEKEADSHAGTKAAEKWSKLADSWWQTGVDAGCSWAA